MTLTKILPTYDSNGTTPFMQIHMLKTSERHFPPLCCTKYTWQLYFSRYLHSQVCLLYLTCLTPQTRSAAQLLRELVRTTPYLLKFISGPSLFLHYRQSLQRILLNSSHCYDNSTRACPICHSAAVPDPSVSSFCNTPQIHLV